MTQHLQQTHCSHLLVEFLETLYLAYLLLGTHARRHRYCEIVVKALGRQCGSIVYHTIVYVSCHEVKSQRRGFVQKEAVVWRICRTIPRVAIRKSFQHSVTIGIAPTLGSQIHGSVFIKSHISAKVGPNYHPTIFTRKAKTRKRKGLKIERLQVREGCGSNDRGRAGRFGWGLWWRHWGGCHWRQDWLRWHLDWVSGHWDGSGSRGNDCRSIHVGGYRDGI
jgi:hypothetical protein